VVGFRHIVAECEIANVIVVKRTERALDLWFRQIKKNKDLDIVILGLARMNPDQLIYAAAVMRSAHTAPLPRIVMVFFLF
jgi:hypothetical protein